MVYQGSKNRISKFLVPIIQKYIDDNNIKTYIEPMVGGANIIDKIVCENKVGGDINSELIALLQYIQTDNEISIAPEMCTFEHYADVRENRRLHTNKYSMKYTALIGYCDSYVEPDIEDEIIFYYENYTDSITGAFPMSEIGKTIFLTHEEAEKKLEEMKK